MRWWGVSSSKKDDGRGVDRRDAERKGEEWREKARRRDSISVLHSVVTPYQHAEIVQKGKENDRAEEGRADLRTVR